MSQKLIEIISKKNDNNERQITHEYNKIKFMKKEKKVINHYCKAAGHGQKIIKIINNTGSERHMTQWMYIYNTIFVDSDKNKNIMLIKIHCFIE